MSVKVLSAAVIGLDCQKIEVEADIIPANPRFFIVGLPDVAIQESRQRVRSAIKNSTYDWPRGQINVNLAPADIKKQGPAYDLPIALSILIAHKEIQPQFNFKKSIFIGELSLDGQLRPVNGVISIALMAKHLGIQNIFLPASNSAEAALIENLDVFPVDNLDQIIQHLIGQELIQPFVLDKKDFLHYNQVNSLDMQYIQGQQQVKRALEIAAAGGHNIIMQGPPGAGKTLLARTMPTILPQMQLEESLEVTKIYSTAGLLPQNRPLIVERPFRAPHHTASGVSLVGGGAWPKPGEISLAHNGVLFLDEFPEFPRSVLENLRQPLEDGIIHISRAQGTLEFPAKFVLVASMNPCPCGYLTDSDQQCTCSQAQIEKYQSKISGPLLDRIDIHIEVPKVDIEKLQKIENEEKSIHIRKRVSVARQIQLERFKESGFYTNSEMNSDQARKMSQAKTTALELLKQAAHLQHFSARTYYRMLKMARTIADLEGSHEVLDHHIAEALQYRESITQKY